MTLDEKLDWIARRLYYSGPKSIEEISEFRRIFEQPQPKPEENKRKGLFLK